MRLLGNPPAHKNTRTERHWSGIYSTKRIVGLDPGTGKGARRPLEGHPSPVFQDFMNIGQASWCMCYKIILGSPPLQAVLTNHLNWQSMSTFIHPARHLPLCPDSIFQKDAPSTWIILDYALHGRCSLARQLGEKLSSEFWILLSHTIKCFCHMYICYHNKDLYFQLIS